MSDPSMDEFGPVMTAGIATGTYGGTYGGTSKGDITRVAGFFPASCNLAIVSAMDGRRSGSSSSNPGTAMSAGS